MCNVTLYPCQWSHRLTHCEQYWDTEISYSRADPSKIGKMLLIQSAMALIRSDLFKCPRRPWQRASERSDRTPKWNSAIVHFIIYTSDFPALTKKVLSEKVLFQKPPFPPPVGVTTFWSPHTPALNSLISSSVYMPWSCISLSYCLLCRPSGIPAFLSCYAASLVFFCPFGSVACSDCVPYCRPLPFFFGFFFGPSKPFLYLTACGSCFWVPSLCS